MSTQPSITRRHALGLLFGAGCGLVSVVASRRLTAQGEPATVYFYSPETNINNFSALKGEFDAYLAIHGNHKFQPFNDRATFERFLAEGTRGVFILSSWHFAQLPAKEHWEPRLVGAVRNKSTQRHMLYGKISTTAVADLRGATIATAGTPEFARTLLAQMIGPGDPSLLASVKLLAVPKEIDALMAVGFGMARAAIATENGAEKLAKINPKQFEVLRVVASGRESLLPVVVLPVDADAQVRGLATLLAGMGEDEEGQQRLKLLGLETLRPLDESQKKGLTLQP